MAIDPNDSHDSISETVQEYLDILLSRATENPGAQLPSESVSVDKQKNSNSTKPVITVNDSVTLLSPRANNRRGDTKQDRQQQPVSKNYLDPAVKPYAEPLNPSALKTLFFQPESAVPVETTVATEQKKQSLTEKVTDKSAIKNLLVQEKKHSQKTVTTSPHGEPLEKPALEKTSIFEPSQWLANGHPSWAQQRFECLLFFVGGLKLAVPLVELGSIYPIGDELTSLFGQVDWFMGLLPIKEGNLRTIDTAKIVMPERYNPKMVDQYRYVISINQMDWGLAVDDVATAITLDPEEVRWRSQRSKRPWLAGTVVKQMCSLVDVSQLAVMFEAQDINR